MTTSTGLKLVIANSPSSATNQRVGDHLRADTAIKTTGTITLQQPNPATLQHVPVTPARPSTSSWASNPGPGTGSRGYNNNSDEIRRLPSTGRIEDQPGTVEQFVRIILKDQVGMKHPLKITSKLAFMQ